MEKDMTRNRNPTAPPGDIAMDPKARQDPQAQPISDREKALVRRAYALFDHFYEQLRADHEEMLEARRMRRLRQAQMSQTAPPSNTLNSCIDNAIADQVDNMPEARMVPEREETARSAEELTDVVSYVLYHAGWPGQYQRIMEDAVVTGTGVAQVYWDDELEDGEGMVSVTMWHPEDFYPDPRVENLQEGRGCFKATRTTIAWVEEHYPDARGYVGADDYAGDRETAPEAPDGDAETTLLEFWYKRYDAAKKKTRVHMALLAGRALLFSSETGFGAAREDEYSEGVYAHGQYPFTVFKYRDVFRSPFGTGLVHDYKETQHAIDRCLKYIDDNARESSCNKYFVRRGSGINTEDIADRSRQIVEWDGNDIREVLQTVQAQPLNGQVYQIMQYMVDTMKQDSGQNQFSRGEGGLGVTAASAIQSLIEAGGKLTRWHTEQFKDSFRGMVEQILWVLSEYMTPGRRLRIVGGWDNTENMQDRFIELNAPKEEGDALRKPAYSVRVQVQKNNPLQNQAHNEFVQQVTQVCAQYGQPLPPEVVVRLMRDVPNKTSIIKAIRENGTMQDEIRALQAQNEELQGQLRAKDAVIASDAKALGTTSIAQASKSYAAGIDADPAATQQTGMQKGEL